MSRRHRSNRRPVKHRRNALEPDFSLEGRVVKDNTNSRTRKDRNGGSKNRAFDSAESLRSRRHHRHGRRINLETDTDGDFSMLPTPPSTPQSPSTAHPNSKRGVNGLGRGRRHAPERVFGRPSTSDRETPEQSSEVAFKNFRFRHQILALLDQQRATVETWAESVGAGGPAEPMDWQPEQERVVYFARTPVEDRCYADRWRIGEETKGIPPSAPESGSWATERWLDAGGSMMCGAPTLGLGFLEEID